MQPNTDRHLCYGSALCNESALSAYDHGTASQPMNKSADEQREDSQNPTANQPTIQTLVRASIRREKSTASVRQPKQRRL
mmetsp:Transcript_28152/g.70314  ORF Transcript_28152/g.70314 Transcript_28152/m.70314 type:complete len:80 (+) Transcript_28152:54-293(+)